MSARKNRTGASRQGDVGSGRFLKVHEGCSRVHTISRLGPGDGGRETECGYTNWLSS